MPVSPLSTAFVADPELMKELEKRATPVDVGGDRVLFRQGEAPVGVYLLRKGIASLTNRSDGDPLLDVQAGAGSLLGVPAVVGAKPYTLTAKALEGAEVSLMKCEDFVHLMHTEPALSFRVLQLLAAEVRFARDTFSEL
jgi:CRP-like cAMP-binding protein